MGFLASLFGKKNPIKSISTDELKISEIQLKRKVEDIHSEIHRLELEEKHLIESGRVTESLSEKKSYSGQITYIRNQKTAKLANQSQIQNQLRSISNLIIIKEQWKDLPENVKRVLIETPPEKMENYLVEMMFDTKSAADQRDLIIHMTNDMVNTGADSQEDEEGILPELLAPVRESGPSTQEVKNKTKKEFE